MIPSPIMPRRIAQMKTKWLETNALESRQELRIGWHGNQYLKDKLNEIRIVLDDKSCVIRLDPRYHSQFKQLENLIKMFCKVM